MTTMKSVEFPIDISQSDLSEEEILVHICDCDSLEDLTAFFKNHKIELRKNERYDPEDYKHICNALLSSQTTEYSKIQYSHWLTRVGNKLFSVNPPRAKVPGLPPRVSNYCWEP